MRITLVSYDDTPPQGGQGVVVAGMRRGLEAVGVDVTTISGRGDHAIGFPRITRRAPLDLSLYLNRHPEVIARTTPDVVHLHSGPGGVLLTRAPAQPLVVTAHHTYRQAYSLRSLRRSLSRIEARCYRQAQRVLAVSSSTADAVRALGVDSARVEVVPPGIDLPVIDERRRVPGRILFVGRLEPEKGVLDAVAVMEQLVEAHPGASARVIGRGSLRQRVAAACTGPVEFLGGVDEARLAQEYAAAEVVLVPSRYEGLGLVALEAMAAGAVVCGYSVTGLTDAALGAAQLVEPGDIGALRQAADHVLDDTQRRHSLAARGREAVAHQHSWERHVARLVEIYQEL